LTRSSGLLKSNIGRIRTEKQQDELETGEVSTQIVSSQWCCMATSTGPSKIFILLTANVISPLFPLFVLRDVDDEYQILLMHMSRRVHRAFVDLHKLLYPPILPVCSSSGSPPFVRRRAVTYAEGKCCVSGVVVASKVLNDCERPFSDCGAVRDERTAFSSVSSDLRCDIQRKALRDRVSAEACGICIVLTGDIVNRCCCDAWLESILALELSFC
jgi:hypothetical protein